MKRGHVPLRKPLPEDVDFMRIREEMANIREAIQPLTRKLAARLARKRKHKRKGPLDFRATVRQSLSYGGVPAEPRFETHDRINQNLSLSPISRAQWQPSPASFAPGVRLAKPIQQSSFLCVHRWARRSNSHVSR